MSIICGDCLEEMRKMEDNSISAIVTDPPYGLSFMGKGWDNAVPDINYWKECLRVQKPGSFLIAMGGTRTFHRLTCAIEDAGFEIRDCISWLYGSGFPKSHNHFGIEGYGTALKPAWEPCIVAMKPLEGTFKQNAEKWGQAGINIDGCRIKGSWNRSTTHRDDIRGGNFIKDEKKLIECEPQECNAKGRWPANVIFDEEAAGMLDEQSGISKSSSAERKNGEFKSVAKGRDLPHSTFGHSDSGGASRFFYCAKASSSERNEGLGELPYNEGGMKNSSGRGTSEGDSMGPVYYKNNHPTVKPLKLMEYLIKLVMPPKDGILLDPFAGSGTTILAAHNLGMKAIGIEKDPNYAEIARARLANLPIKQIDSQLDLFDGCTGT